MAKLVKVFQSNDGKTFPTLEAANQNDVVQLIVNSAPVAAASPTLPGDQFIELVSQIVAEFFAQREAILPLLKIRKAREPKVKTPKIKSAKIKPTATA